MKTLDFYTVVLRHSPPHWVALCLENGIVGQGDNQDLAITKLKEAIDSMAMAPTPTLNPADIYSAPVPIQELHEFLTIEALAPITQTYELRAVYA